jgi:signal transduction histidine kinase/DNA-binding response OmpR family regulator
MNASNNNEKSKILYIDDTPSARKLVERLLSRRYKFYEAVEGLSGIDKAVEVEPDLILVDLHMPHFSGYEVATRVKELLPDVPVVALTADISDHVRERALASGCIGYIPKPIDPDMFEAQVSGFLGGEREELEDDTYREEYQQTLVSRLEEKVRELTQALQRNAELNERYLRLLEEAQRRARLLEAGARAGQGITSILDLDDLLQSTVEIIGKEFGFYYVGVFLVDETGEWAVLRAGMGDPGRKMVEEGHKLKVGGLSMIGAATARQRAIITKDVKEEAVHFKNPHLPRTRSEMALPLILGNKVIGALTVQSVEEDAFNDDDIWALQAMVDQLATAIQNARLYEQNERLLSQAERRTRLLEAAAEVGRGVTSILEMDGLLNKTVDIICDAYGFYYVGVFLVDEEGDDGDDRWAVLQAGHGEAGEKMVEEGHKLKVGGLSMIGTSIAERKALIALDVGEEPVHFKNPHLPLTRSEMALPLILGDEVIGALTVQSVEEAAFSDEDITSLQTMADQLSIAINNARLLADLKEAHEELVRTKTFEAIATATSEAIHWVGNKAAPIPGSIARVTEDVVKYLIMANAVMEHLPEAHQSDKFAQMLQVALEDISGPVDVATFREDLDRFDFRRLRRMLSVESVLEDLDIIDKSAQSILNIKEDLIGPARQKHVEPLYLPELLSQTLKSMGIEPDILTTVFADNIQPVLGDRRQLDRVFINLIKNALEAMYQVPEDEKRLTVRVHMSDDGKFVVTEIEDIGEGIPPDKIDKIWVAFYTTKGDRGGTGLGLAACAKIIDQLGGKITVDSEVGEGTIFSVWLPTTDQRPT